MTGPRRSAGLLLHRTGAGGRLEVLVAHMGGPFWARKDEGAWSIPKGEYEPDEDPVAAARREFTEELGLPVPDGPLVALGEVRQSSGNGRLGRSPSGARLQCSITAIMCSARSSWARARR
jgi:predicted NUDIX family NTP pyrophosphohydrolase